MGAYGMAFSCVVVTPEQQLLDESLQQAIIPAADGLLGILTGRSPLLARLGAGPLRLDLASGQKRSYFIDGGIAQMIDNRLTILAHGAIPAEDLTAQVAQGEYDRAMARQPGNAVEAEQRQEDLRRARAKMMMAKR
jgi:F-type H+-transporting ATPase subunit epsilon